MARAFSVLSWNVEHFGATGSRTRKPVKDVAKVIQTIADQKADVVAIYEVVGAEVFREIVRIMPGYQFHITEGPQTQEILVGVKRTLTSFFTQKLEFKTGQESLRPGALLTVIVDGEYYPLLFLHLKSLTVPKGFGLRDDMTERAIDFRKVLEGKGGGTANYIFLGDLNTMGMNLTYSQKDITAAEEIDRLKKRAAKQKMAVLEKTEQNTFWPGSGSAYLPGNLDHVVAANHLKFKLFQGKPVDVRGWPQLNNDAARDQWAQDFSDHAMLYFEVQRV